MKAFGILAALPVVVAAQPGLEWDPPAPVDARITDYEVHCSVKPAPIVIDGSQLIVSVPVTETSTAMLGALPLGFEYDCAAVSVSSSYGMQSGPSNIVSLDVRTIESPINLRVGSLTLNITVE